MPHLGGAVNLEWTLIMGVLTQLSLIVHRSHGAYVDPRIVSNGWGMSPIEFVMGIQDQKCSGESRFFPFETCICKRAIQTNVGAAASGRSTNGLVYEHSVQSRMTRENEAVVWIVPGMTSFRVRFCFPRVR